MRALRGRGGSYVDIDFAFAFFFSKDGCPLILPSSYRGYLHARAKPSLQWLQVILDARLARKADPPKTATTSHACPHCGGTLQKTKRMARAPPKLRNEHFFDVVAA